MIREEKRPTDFKPAWWATGAHRQTILSALLPVFSVPPLIRKRVETCDGDFLDFDILEGRVQTPLVLLLHGLEGSARSPYIRSMLSRVAKRGWRAIAINMRGCSGEDSRLKTTYHAGHTADLNRTVTQIIKKEKRVKLFLVGYSLGGNILLKWLGEQGEEIPRAIQKAVAVSVPYHLAKSVSVLDQGFNRAVYTRAMLAGLKAKALRKEKKYPKLIPAQRIKRCQTFERFDDEVTARLNGFKDAWDYWEKSSSIHFLNQIRTRTLLIHAKDDPFFPEAFFPFEEIKDSAYLETLVTDAGGHLGFLTGHIPLCRQYWLEDKILDYFEGAIPSIENNHSSSIIESSRKG